MIMHFATMKSTEGLECGDHANAVSVENDVTPHIIRSLMMVKFYTFEKTK
jgi:hypothetical protein